MADTANVLVGVAEITLGVGINANVIGYTVDGVNMTVRSTFFDAKVEENEGTLIRRLTDQEVTVTLNVAEGTLANLAAAIPGCSLDVPTDTLTIGGIDLQEHRLTLRGTTPAGRDRVIVLNSVNPTGEVTTPYKKGDITVVPMTFSALVDDDEEFGSILDAADDPPTLVTGETGAETRVPADGETVIAVFNDPMGAVIGKFDEFWFNCSITGERLFDLATVSANEITLRVLGNAIKQTATITLSYRLGTVISSTRGVLDTFLGSAVDNNSTIP